MNKIVIYGVNIINLSKIDLILNDSPPYFDFNSIKHIIQQLLYWLIAWIQLTAAIKRNSGEPGLNWWPFELQSNALPLSYPRISCSAWFQVLIQINFNKTYKSINTKVMSPVLIPSKAALA